MTQKEINRLRLVVRGYNRMLETVDEMYWKVSKELREAEGNGRPTDRLKAMKGDLKLAFDNLTKSRKQVVRVVETIDRELDLDDE